MIISILIAWTILISYYLMQNQIKKFFCKLFRHSQLTIIEEYSRTEKQELSVGCGQTLVYIPVIKSKINCKWRCKRCGSIGVGVVEQLRHEEK